MKTRVKSRSAVEICLPLAVLCIACACSVTTRLIAATWMGVGVACLGHRPLRDFPRDGIELRWQFGIRAWILWCFHMAWWPWYVRSGIAGAIGALRRWCPPVTRRSRRGLYGESRVEPPKDD
jgi:hypothetical protein